MYDFAFGTLLLIETNFVSGVTLRDIVTINELEEVVKSVSFEHGEEISVIVDASLTLAFEYPTFDRSPSRAKYRGLATFFTTTDAYEFFDRAGHRGWDHKDQIYGWSEAFEPKP